MNRYRTFLLVLLAVFAVLSALIIVPYLQYVLAAILLGYVLYPLRTRIAPVVGPQVAAALLILVAVFVVLLPLAALIGFVAREARAVLRAIETGEFDVVAIELATQRYLGLDVSVDDLIGSTGEAGRQAVLANVIEIFGGLTNVAIGVTVLLFVLYYLLKDGRALVRWTRSVTPLPSNTQDELYARIDQLMWAVLVGNVLVAVVQGVLTGIGLALTGFSSVLFWTVMTIFLALLPLIGASVIWVPAALYLVAIGRVLPGIFLFSYGTIVVSLSDNYLRPVIGGREGNLNPGLFVLGIFGGLAVFGFMGIFFGPIVLGTAKVLVEVFAREFEPAP